LVEEITISWLPAQVAIPPLASVEGRNFTLKETLSLARQQGLAILAWEPVEIRRELFALAKARKRQLESGSLAYKMIDWSVRPNGGVNCIHAITDMIPGAQLDTGSARGEQATDMVARFLRPYMVDTSKVYPQLLDLLHVKPATLTMRSLR
jgi:hypothetical protein